jgi:hypothetical protein
MRDEPILGYDPGDDRLADWESQQKNHRMGFRRGRALLEGICIGGCRRLLSCV